MVLFENVKKGKKVATAARSLSRSGGGLSSLWRLSSLIVASECWIDRFPGTWL
jgi:hypothetical protein